MRLKVAQVLIGMLISYLLSGGTILNEEEIVGTSNIEWTNIYGGDIADWGTTVQQTSDEGYIIGGNTQSSGAGHTDAWLLKTNANGTLEWACVFGGAWGDYVGNIQQTLDGGYILIGHNGSGGGPWLVKVNSIGDLQWEQTFEGIDSLYASG